MRKSMLMLLAGLVLLTGFAGAIHAAFWNRPKTLNPTDGKLLIPLASVSDGKAHHFKVKATDGTEVVFFILKSSDGVIRAAVDACDVCYRAGKGYEQDGDSMVCRNCGMRFASNRINEVKGGCNPAPLARRVEGGNLVIAMSDIDENSWYCKYRN